MPPVLSSPARWSRPLVAAVAVLVVLALLGVLKAARQQAGATSPPAYASTSYAPDGYAAFAQLLVREGIPVRRFRLRTVELDAAVKTLVAAAAPAANGGDTPLTHDEAAALAAWVKRGGTLVELGGLHVTGGPPAHAALPRGARHARARDAAALRGPWAATVGRLAGLRALRLGERRGASVELSDGAGTIAERFALGRGTIVAVSDPAPFSNAWIGYAGNARFAVLLVQAAGANPVFFDDAFHGALIDRPWYRALSPAEQIAFGFATVVVLAGIAGAALRTGPPMRAEPPREPRSDEFVAALAALHERAGARERTARTLTGDALRHVAQAAALPLDTPPRILAAHFTGERRDRVTLLASRHTDPIDSDAALLSVATLAATIRREFSDDAARDGRRPAARRRTRAGGRR